MPYASVSEVPDYVPKDKRKQWLEVWNSAYERAKKDGKSKDDAEQSAFAQANAVAGPNAKKEAAMAAVIKIGDKLHQKDVNYTATAPDPKKSCARCRHFDKNAGNSCELVAGNIADVGWCEKFELCARAPEGGESAISVGDGGAEFQAKAAGAPFEKFIPFAKVDAQKREVWGIVTAELPDKDDEVCDYETTAPYYKALIDEMQKATEKLGEDRLNLFPLRAMHQMIAAGKGIGFDFRKSDREIYMGFKVVDDDEWKKCDEGVYTGFSHGGAYVKTWADPVFKGCTRYTAKPSEVSLVDNPCLGVAHFDYVKADGTHELRKLRSVAGVAVSRDRWDEMQKMVKTTHDALVRRGFIKEAKTKRVAGKDLTASSFAYVGDPEDTSTWKLPVHDAAHARNALARFNQTQGIPAGEKDAVWKKIVAAAKKFGVEVASEKARLDAIMKFIRHEALVRCNRLARKSGLSAHSLAYLDSDLGKLKKGMYEVSRLAQLVQALCFTAYDVASEQAYEGDESSVLPSMLATNVKDILDTLLAMVEEEASEMREEIDARAQAQ